MIGLLLLAAVLCLTAVPGRADAAVQKSGLVKVRGKYYYYQSGKAVKNTWKKVKGSKYYFGKNGAAVTKSTKIGKTYYVFSTKGVLLTGKGVHVKKISGKYYQIDKKGRAKAGWDKAKVYCYAKNGARIRKGWSTDKKYYLDARGKKAKGIIVTGGLQEDGETWVDPKFAALDENTGLADKALTAQLNKLAKYEQDFAPLKALIGEPLKASYTDGCYGDGKDGHLVYKNFAIDIYRDTDGKEIFMGFSIDV